MKHNTLFDAESGIEVPQDQGGIRTIDSNYVYSLDLNSIGNVVQRLVSWRYGADASMDYNTYINHYNTTNTFRDESNYYNFTGWKSATSQDANSIIDNSAFTTEQEVLLYNNTKAAVSRCAL